MSTFNDPSAAREVARQDNGQFGVQPRAEAGGVDLLPASAADFDPAAVEAAVTEAKRTGKPVVIEHPAGNRIDLDEERLGSMAGDYSVGAEPSLRYTWATGSDDEPFVSVTETTWVSARLDNANDDLDYDDWQAAKESREMWEADGGDLADGRPPAPPMVRYSREDITEWISHTDVNDPGGTELRSEYERGEGSALHFSSLVNAEADARRHLKSLEPSMYAPENWK